MQSRTILYKFRFHFREIFFTHLRSLGSSSAYQPFSAIGYVSIKQQKKPKVAVHYHKGAHTFCIFIRTLCGTAKLTHRGAYLMSTVYNGLT